MTTEWINARKQKPPEGDEGRSDDVLVCYPDDTCEVLYYDHAFEVWARRDGRIVFCSPLWWMPLPDPPMPEAS